MTAGHRHILVVEDDQEPLANSWSPSQRTVIRLMAATGNDALSLGLSADYAVITIDRMLRTWTDGSCGACEGRGSLPRF